MPRTTILFIAALTSLSSAASAQGAKPAAADMIERIMQADANGDGQITRAELLAYRAQQFSRLDRNGDGFIAINDVPSMMASRFEPRMKQLTGQFDANHDGRVGRDEFVNGPTTGFDLADADHNGVVAQAEMRVAMAKAKAMRSQ